MTARVNECYTQTMDSNEERFHKLLAILAARCKTELDEVEIEIYDRQLSKHGYASLCGALEAILIERGSSDPFPSIGAIMGKLGLQATPKSLAMDVTNRIVTAVRNKGWNWDQKVEDFEADQLRVLGEAGVAVVKRLGGWMSVIELANGNPNQYRSWIRDSAVAVIESSGSKLLSLAPAPAPSQIEDKSK